MLYIGPGEIRRSDDHEGFVSARTWDGRDTGIWTDVRAGGDHVGFRAACECGWSDRRFHAPDETGYRAAQLAFVHRHFCVIAGYRLDPADFLTPPPVPARPVAHA